MKYAIYAAMVVVAAALGGCVSTQMKQYLGQDISEVLMRYGQPEQVIDLPTRQRAFQFRYGGGSVMLPGSSQSSGHAYGNAVTVSTVSTPAMFVDTKGCLLTFIGAPQGKSWRVVDIRVPKELTC